MRISDWSSDVCSSDLITSPWKWRHLKSVIVPSVQSPPSMLKLHDFCNRARAIATPDAEALADRLDAMMPRIRITELLHEVARETGFLAAFTNLRTGAPCPNENALPPPTPAHAPHLALSPMAAARPGPTP